jgi:hypothetical protein
MQLLFVIFKNIGYLISVFLAGLIVGVEFISNINKTVLNFYNITPLAFADSTIRKFLIGFSSTVSSIIVLAIFTIVCFFITDVFMGSYRYKNKN